MSDKILREGGAISFQITKEQPDKENLRNVDAPEKGDQKKNDFRETKIEMERKDDADKTGMPFESSQRDLVEVSDTGSVTIDIDIDAGGPSFDGGCEAAGPTKKGEIRQKAIKFTKSVTLVGLRHAIDENSSKSRRYIWMTWIIFGLVFAFYQIQDRIVYYRSYPFNTEFQLKNVQKLPFPQVTICKQNPFLENKFKESEFYGTTREIRSQLYERGTNGTNAKEESNGTSDGDADRFISFEDLLANLHNATKDYGTILRNLSEPLDSCVRASFARRRIEGEIVATDVGFCIAFGTVGHQLTSTEHGVKAGLKLFINCSESKSLSFLITEQDALSGYRILIHDPTEIPLMADSGFLVPGGTAAQISIAMDNITNLAQPYGECNDDPSYRLSNCIAAGDQTYTETEFGCRLFHTEGNETTCSLFQTVLNELYALYDQNMSNYRSNCLPQCHEQLYSYSVTQSPITKTFREEILPMISPESVGSNDTQCNIIYVYYPQLMYTEINSVPSYCFFTLLCDVGGALSLLLGATLLTIYEVGEFLALIARDYYFYRRLELQA